MMLHVRVVSPADRTARLTELLEAEAGVSNVVHMTDPAHRPDGAAVSFDVSSAAANRVLALLRALGLDSDGAICVDRVAAVLTRPAAPGERGRARRSRGALRREVAPVWEVVEAAIHDGE